MKNYLILSCCLLVCSLAYGETTVFEGIPLSMTVSSRDSSELEEIPKDKTLSWRCKIVKDQGRYLWASNNDRELIYVAGDDISYFYPKDGGGYIKIMKGALGGSDATYTYAEAFEQYDEVRIFWGISEEYAP